MKYKINSIQEFEQVIERLFPRLIESDALLLIGNLGLGKTTFSKCFAKKAGVEAHVKSPTFSIISTYSMRVDTNSSYQKNTLHHCDLYRIMSEEELYEIGFEDLFQTNSLLIIEWADLFLEYIKELCPNHTLIRLYFEGENRVMEIEWRS